MSSILKALRKIEEDKRTSVHAAPDLRTDQGVAPATSKPLGPLFAGIVLGAAVVGIFFIWFSSNDTPVAQNISPAKSEFPVSHGSYQKDTTAVKAESQPPTPVATASPGLKSIPPEEAHEKPAQNDNIPVVVLPPEPVPVAQKAIAAQPVTKPGANVTREKTVKKVAKDPSAVALKSGPVTLAAKASEPLSTLPEGVTLAVSDIFYDADSSNSMAVVNDLPVMVGTYIDSAVVLEIRSDSVLFKIDEQTYVVNIPSL